MLLLLTLNQKPPRTLGGWKLEHCHTQRDNLWLIKLGHTLPLPSQWQESASNVMLIGQDFEIQMQIISFACFYYAQRRDKKQE